MTKIPAFALIVHTVAKILFYFAPLAIVTWLVRLITGMPDAGANVTAQFLQSKYGVWQALHMAKGASKRDEDDYDYDEYDDEDEEAQRDPHAAKMQKTQSLAHIRISQPGTVRLTDVTDSSRVGARIIYPSEVTIAPCPRAQFVDGDAITRGDNVRCAAPGLGSVGGRERDVELGLSIYGVPPLSLKWFKDINGKREYFTVEGIQEGHATQTDGIHSSYAAAQDVHVPLTVSADALGTHTYALESVMDGLGNVAYMSHSVLTKDSNSSISTDANTKNTRTLHVLRRPTVSFKGCALQGSTEAGAWHRV